MEVLHVLHLCNVPPRIIKNLVNRGSDNRGSTSMSYFCTLLLEWISGQVIENLGRGGISIPGNQSIKRDKSYWPIGQGQKFQLSTKSKMFKNLSQMSKKSFQLSKNLLQISELSHFYKVHLGA